MVPLPVRCHTAASSGRPRRCTATGLPCRDSAGSSRIGHLVRTGQGTRRTPMDTGAPFLPHGRLAAGTPYRGMYRGRQSARGKPFPYIVALHCLARGLAGPPHPTAAPSASPLLLEARRNLPADSRRAMDSLVQRHVGSRRHGRTASAGGSTRTGFDRSG